MLAQGQAQEITWLSKQHNLMDSSEFGHKEEPELQCKSNKKRSRYVINRTQLSVLKDNQL